MNLPATLPAVTLVGHPFAVLGMGRTHRMLFHALRAAGVTVSSLDVYGGDRGIDARAAAQIVPHLTRDFSPSINIFTLNADEVAPSLKHLGQSLPDEAYNVIVPFWELENYPYAWVEQLSLFDEIWASSSHIANAIDLAVHAPVATLLHPIEPKITRYQGRHAFGISESAYAFLLNFDFRSYSARKNPEGALQAFEALLQARPDADVQLVLKVTGFREHPQALDRLRARLARLHGRVVLLAELMDDDTVNSLTCACDCFLSLHRAEGFGQGLADAMFFGKPVIATAYSGNMDFMSADDSLLVPYEMIALQPGDYPHADGQRWAEPDIADATQKMIALIDNPGIGRAIGDKAAVRIRTQLSLRATGLAYRMRLEQIWAQRKVALPAQKSATL